MPAYSTSARTRSGRRRARRMQGIPPEAYPSSTTRSLPAASSTAATSSTSSSSVTEPSSGSDRPTPRRSMIITRAKEPRRSKKDAIPGSSQSCSRCDVEPGTNSTSIVPSPEIE